MRGMHNTPDPRKFYCATRALLAPSLWQETFGRVTAESLINGIPVLCSTRGGLPEVVNKGGFLFDIPAKFTPDSKILPAGEEVEPWVQTIERLWDDESFYVQACLRARVEAEKWQHDRLADRYAGYFRQVLDRDPG
jgi:glycosyltransferase involved in cell wall biosynthesis